MLTIFPILVFFSNFTDLLSFSPRTTDTDLVESTKSSLIKFQNQSQKMTLYFNVFLKPKFHLDNYSTTGSANSCPHFCPVSSLLPINVSSQADDDDGDEDDDDVDDDLG